MTRTYVFFSEYVKNMYNIFDVITALMFLKLKQYSVKCLKKKMIDLETLQNYYKTL